MMATTKSSAKASPGNRPAPAKAVTAAKVKPAGKAKSAAKPEQAAKAKPASKARATPKAVAGKPAPSRGNKPAVIPLEQRRNYIEVAAFYIAERRGFAPGNPLEDWTQAEAEIDRLLAKGRLGS
jgi:hypothetical protein